jgi:dimethylhistidine N-methyltransferase
VRSETDALSPAASAFARDVRRGLSRAPKQLPSVYFYDAEGSRLFEEICRTEEYYVTRAEIEILAARAPEIAARSAPDTEVIELGSGNGDKALLLLKSLRKKQGRLRYVPIDVSAGALAACGRALADRAPGVEFAPIIAEYLAGLRRLPAPRGPRLFLWLGSNLGNFDRASGKAFLRGLAGSMRPRDRLLLGIDLRKDAQTLERAYDDASGVTARFNKNLLARINRELGGGFVLERFRHRAWYDDQQGRIAMFLESARAQTVPIRCLALEVAFEEGERIHTEDSFKYSRPEIMALGPAAGLAVEVIWCDRAGRFADVLFTKTKR